MLRRAEIAAGVYRRRPLHNAATGLDATISKTTLGKMTVKETTGPNEPNPLYTVETIDVEKPTLAAPSEGGIERGIGAEGVATTPTGGLSSNVVESMNRVKRALYQNQQAPRRV